LLGFGDEDVSFRDISEVVGRRLYVPPAPIDPDYANDHLGFIGTLVQLDNPTPNALTRELLGWPRRRSTAIVTRPAGDDVRSSIRKY